MNCSTCGKEITGKFCSGCGSDTTVQATPVTDVPMQTTCASCGNVADGKFCGTCGAPASQFTTAPIPQPVAAPVFTATVPNASQFQPQEQTYQPPQQQAYAPQQGYAAPQQPVQPMGQPVQQPMGQYSQQPVGQYSQPPVGQYSQPPVGQYNATQQQYAPAYGNNMTATQTRRKRKPIVPILIIAGVLLAAAAILFIFFIKFAPSANKFNSVMTANGYTVSISNSNMSSAAVMGYSIKEAYEVYSRENNTDFMYVRMGSASQAESLYKMLLMSEKSGLDSDDIIKETGGLNYKTFIITDTYSEYIDGVVIVGDVLIYIDGYLDEKVLISTIMSGLGFSGIL